MPAIDSHQMRVLLAEIEKAVAQHIRATLRKSRPLRASARRSDGIHAAPLKVKHAGCERNRNVPSFARISADAMADHPFVIDQARTGWGLREFDHTEAIAAAQDDAPSSSAKWLSRWRCRASHFGPRCISESPRGLSKFDYDYGFGAIRNRKTGAVTTAKANYSADGVNQSTDLSLFAGAARRPQIRRRATAVVQSRKT